MFDKKDIEYVAKLAKLKLTEEEKEKLTPQMADIINFAKQVEQINTEGVNPTAHVFGSNNIFRKDEIEPSFKRNEILENAPVKEAGCIVVPEVNS